MATFEPHLTLKMLAIIAPAITKVILECGTDKTVGISSYINECLRRNFDNLAPFVDNFEITLLELWAIHFKETAYDCSTFERFRSAIYAELKAYQARVSSPDLDHIINVLLNNR